MPTREKAKTFHGRCSSESSPLTGRLDRRRGCHRQIHDLRDNEGGTPSLETGVALAVSARCVLPGSDSLLPEAACQPRCLVYPPSALIQLLLLLPLSTEN